MAQRYWIVILLLFILSIAPAFAQQESNCPAIVERALAAVGNNCAGLDRNTACYGYNQVDATFASIKPLGFFSTPADRADLHDISTLRTAGLDEINDIWGVAVMSLQANLPNTLPGQAVSFLLLGDVVIENQVNPEQVFSPSNGVEVVTSIPTMIYQRASTESAAVVTVTAGETLLADGLNMSGTWLRVVSGSNLGWIPTDTIIPNAELQALPPISALNQTPMQAFYFSTGIGQPKCQEAESALAMQVSGDLSVELSMNGVDIRVGSMVTLKSTGPNRIILTVHEGKVETADGIIIEAGQTVEAELDEDGNIKSWSPVRPATPDELALGQRAEQGFVNLGLPPTISVVEINDQANTCGQGGHLVGAGDTLFNIAIRYDTSMQAILDANGLADPNIIFVGQCLIIPEQGSGFAGLSQPVISTTATTTGDCSGFKPTSPLGSIPGGDTTFYWDPAVGATQYQVNFYNELGQLTDSRLTSGSETYLNVNTGTVGVGSQMQWQVVALADGTVLCTSGLTATGQRDATYTKEDMARLLAPEPTTTPLPFTASWSCTGSGQATVTWNNSPGGTVMFEYFDGEMQQTYITSLGTAINGNGTVSPVWFASGAKLTTSQGGHVSLPDLGC